MSVEKGKFCLDMNSVEQQQNHENPHEMKQWPTQIISTCIIYVQ